MKKEKKAFKTISMEEYNREIEKALEDIQEGRVHSHEEVRSIMAKWGRIIWTNLSETRHASRKPLDY